MLNIGKHNSYEEPPDLPFFKKPKVKPKDSTSPGPSANTRSKLVGLRTQCIDQLSKWHTLLNSGAIDQAQYNETILCDIKDM